ncbi:MAG: PolC-type DNA polymerase III [Bacilli bacterium]
MHDKLELLLNQINFPDNLFSFFVGGKLKKIVGNKAKDSYQFNIEIDNILPIDVYTKLLELLKKHFEEYKITLVFDVKNIDNDKILEYYLYLINKNMTEYPLLQSFIDSEVTVLDNKIVIEVANKAEQMKFKSIEEKLLKLLNNVGYKKLLVTTKIDKDKGLEVRKEIEASKALVPKEEKKEIIEIMGSFINKITHDVSSIFAEEDNVSVEAYVFKVDFFESSKSSFKIITLKITDFNDSMYAKIFTKDEKDFAFYQKHIKENKWYKFRGYTKYDKYANEVVLNIRDINKSDKVVETPIDNAKIKRVELHSHTMMSQMDGLTKLDLAKHTIEIVDQAIKWGHKAIAITDHNGCQAFPIAYQTVSNYNKHITNEEDKFKVIYGTELTLIDDDINIVIRENDTELLKNTYVVFDFETTGFNAGGGDTIIEIGAVKIFNGEIIETFDELIDPGHKLSAKITEVTNITDDMLKGKPKEEEVVKRFIKWFDNLPMVAHNAKFDTSFLEMAYKKYNLGKYTNMVIDTLELSRILDNNYARHGLSALVKRYDIPWDENAHHRADYDALATGLIFHKMMQKLSSQNIEKVSQLNKMIAKEEIHKYGRSFHVNILIKNKTGLKNLFKIVSLANTKYLFKTPRILRSEINKYREGLLIGSGCYESEVFVQAKSKSEEELANIINFYDYVEVQPPEVYDHLLQTNEFGSKIELLEHLKKIIRVTKESGKIIVATGDVHHLFREDRIYREIIVNQKVPGGGRHPLARNNITQIPSQHFRTTEEMLEDFSFLNKELQEEIVITNPNKIADMIDIIEVIIQTGGVPFSPKIENSVETVKQLVYDKAHLIYGDPLPELIEKRIDQELSGIIKGGYDVIYLIAQKLVKKSNDEGYLVGSRGSVGSSFVATLMGITEVNPLPAHYVCPNCKHSIFEMDGQTLGSVYSSGYDLPNMNCPNCQIPLKKEGQDMPFATFLGFNADKVPDIDLNFSGEYQWKAHEYTKELFGVDNVYRAGTIGTVADKTAYGYVKGYCEVKGISKRSAEIERLALGCTGVKRTTGQHPGGIVVIPDYMDIFDFTPFQYPADDNTSLWRTTHFDYHSIEEDVLKLDILGHDDPTVLRMLQDLSGMDVTTVPLDDKDTMSIFSSPDILGVTKEQIMCETGTIGIPEMGTKFVIGMLVDTRPKTFSELIKISGLSHGTDVWVGNSQDLIRNKTIEFKDVIGCRDDIMVYLMYHGLEPKKAFKIMEFVRKGKATKDPEKWLEFEQEMKEAKIAPWFIESCHKIKYMFPKAHAAAYVISAFRIAWFKVHHPLWYYTAYFSIRCSDFDIETMIKGYDAIKRKIVELTNKGFEKSNKEDAIIDVLYSALEATARGFKFANVSITESDSTNFVIRDDNTLIPPFRTIDGLGDTAAKTVVYERSKGEFLSIDDLQKRGKVSSTIIDKMRLMGVLDGMDESSQLSLF